MPELWFYHLQHVTAETLLPQLLRMGLSRGLKLAVETISPERAGFWSEVLWGQDDTSFLAHGIEGDGNAGAQPICLVASAANTNGASFRFLVDGAMVAVGALSESSDCQRVSVLLDGRDEAAIDAGRKLWREARAAGVVVRYQRQNDSGGWSEATAAAA